MDPTQDTGPTAHDTELGCMRQAQSGPAEQGLARAPKKVRLDSESSVGRLCLCMASGAWRRGGGVGGGGLAPLMRHRRLQHRLPFRRGMTKLEYTWANRGVRPSSPMSHIGLPSGTHVACEG